MRNKNALQKRQIILVAKINYSLATNNKTNWQLYTQKVNLNQQKK